MRKCPVREHEPSSVPEGVQTAFIDIIGKWSSFKVLAPGLFDEVFSHYAKKGFSVTERLVRPTIYICPETLSLRSRRARKYGPDSVDIAYFKFDPTDEHSFNADAILSVDRYRLGTEVRKLHLFSDPVETEDVIQPRSLDIKLMGITQIEAYYRRRTPANPLQTYILDLAYYVPYDKPREEFDRLRSIKITHTSAVEPEVRPPNTRLEIKEAVLEGEKLEALLAGNNVEGYYGHWSIMDNRIRFRQKRSAWYLELHLPKQLPQDLTDLLVHPGTKEHPLSSPHALDQSWRRTQLFNGIAVGTGFHDGENPEFYRFPFL